MNCPFKCNHLKCSYILPEEEKKKKKINYQFDFKYMISSKGSKERLNINIWLTSPTYDWSSCYNVIEMELAILTFL